MRKIVLSLSVLAALLCATSSHAQATRTWVSGVGDDANPCSRTAPCKTFAGAISKTAASGEINVLDPGGFGAVTITKAISIVAEGAIAGIVVSGTNGIIVNAGVNDVVTLRGLNINGLNTGLNGIRFIGGKALRVENCRIWGFTQQGIDFEPNVASAQLHVEDTILNENVGSGILVQPAAGGSAKAAIDRVHAENNGTGFKANATSGGISETIRESVAAANTSTGVQGTGTGTISMFLDHTAVINNGVGAVGTGILADTSANVTIRISDVTVSGNPVGLSATGGAKISSFGNNHISGNVTDGAPTPPNIPVL